MIRFTRTSARRLAVIGMIAVLAMIAETQIARAEAAPLCGGWEVTIDMNLGGDPTMAGPNDVVLGTPGPDYINSGASMICSGDGDDRVVIQSTDTEHVELGAGDDRVRIQGPDIDDLVVWGGEGDDLIVNHDPYDDETFIYGDSGNDTILLLGGTGGENGPISAADLAAGVAGSVVFGGDGDDRIINRAGLSALYGEAGNDLIIGGLHQDYLNGGDGGDKCLDFSPDNFFTECEGTNVVGTKAGPRVKSQHR